MSRYASDQKSNTDAIHVAMDVANQAAFLGAAGSNSTATNRTMTAAEMLAGVFVNEANGALALTTATAAQLVAAIPNCQIGSSFLLAIRNDGDNTVTVTAGTGITIDGTATIATTLGQLFMGKVTAVGSTPAVTLYALLKVAN